MAEPAKPDTLNDSEHRDDAHEREPEPEPEHVDESNDTEFNRLDYVKTFKRVTSKENTSDKVVLVDFFAE